MPAWTDAFALDQLAIGDVRVVKHGGDQVAVFRVAADELVAVDNRCPHEGYPLSQGALGRDSAGRCLLTCNWHNWKFDLSDGSCIMGGEDVRRYPLRVVEARVQLDLSPLDPAAERPRLWRSLEAALLDHDTGRATRDVVRLLQGGTAPAELLAFVAALNGRHAEYGATHVLAVAADLLRWRERYPGPRFALALAPLLDLCGRDCVRRPARPRAEVVDPGPDPVAAGARLRAAVEEEDAALAEGLLLGALQREFSVDVIEGWLLTLCADHFLSFGHRLIYHRKCSDLLAAAEAAHTADSYAADILRGHLFGIICGTREDLLPAWAGYRRKLAALDVDGLARSAGTEPAWVGSAALTAAVAFSRPLDAVDAVVGALQEGASLRAVADALSLAASERMLRFDVAIDGDDAVQDGWLSVTHIQTFAAAVRQTAARQAAGPDVVRLLLQAARFISHHRVLDGEPTSMPEVACGDVAVGDALAAMDAQDTGAAMAVAAALAADPATLAALAEALMDRVLTDRFAVPIVSAHALKNLVVAVDEHAATGDLRPLLAGVRLLSSPLRQRWTARTAAEALAFVTEGRVPRSLAP